MDGYARTQDWIVKWAEFEERVVTILPNQEGRVRKGGPSRTSLWRRARPSSASSLPRSRMGANQSVCGPCASTRTGKAGERQTDPALATVAAWIRAREVGNVEEAAALCHQDFVFSSPQLSLTGLDKAKARLFAQVAPEPEAILMPLRLTSEGVVYREISFKVGYQRLAIRQEWTLIWDEQSKRALIGSVSATRV